MVRHAEKCVCQSIDYGLASECNLLKTDSHKKPSMLKTNLAFQSIILHFSDRPFYIYINAVCLVLWNVRAVIFRKIVNILQNVRGDPSKIYIHFCWWPFSFRILNMSSRMIKSNINFRDGINMARDVRTDGTRWPCENIESISVEWFLSVTYVQNVNRNNSN